MNNYDIRYRTYSIQAMLLTCKYYGMPRIKLYETFISLIYLLFTKRPPPHVLLFVHEKKMITCRYRNKLYISTGYIFLLCNLYI